MNDGPNPPRPAATPVGDRSAHPIRRLLGPALLLIVLVILGQWLGGRWSVVEGALQDMGTAAYAAYGGLFVGLTSLCFPVSVLGVSAGLLFGPWLGFGLAFVSVIASGAVMFALGRSLLRGRIQQMLAGKPRLAAVDRMVGRRAVRLNLLARLSPLNYGLVCYTLAAGRSDFRSYLIGLAATAPSIVAQVWVGVVARQTGRIGSGSEGPSLGGWIGLAVGLVFFVLLGWQVRRLVQTAWQEMEEEADGA